MKKVAGVLLVVLAQGLVGCGSPRAPSSPLAPSSTPQPTPQATRSQVAGIVWDTAYRAVGGANVEVLTGPGAGTSTISSADGTFSLVGTFDGTTRFRATKERYVAGTESINWTGGNGIDIYFRLEMVEAPVNIAGRYTVTFIADPACADQLPTDLRTRTYAATITPDSSTQQPANTALTAALSGASFDHYLNRMRILVAGDYLYFDLSDNYLKEEVAQETYLSIGGFGAASVGTSGVSTIAVSFQGVFEYSGESVARAQCESKSHQLILKHE